MRIAVLTHDGLPNARYRALLPMEELQRRGHEVSFAEVADEQRIPSLAALRGCDVVYFWRLFYPQFWRLARELRGAGIGVVWDNDDDLTNVPRSSVAYAHYGGAKSRSVTMHIREMMRAAHVVTTPSKILAARLARLRGAPVTVIENYVPSLCPKSRQMFRASRGPVVVGWVASLEHRQDWDKIGLMRVFERLLDSHPNVVAMSIGLRLGLSGDRYRHIPHVALEDLPRAVGAFDVGIAPLLDIPFNRARSNIKLKEYAASGVPWLASDVGPYIGMNEKQGGRVVGLADWYEQLEALIENHRLRRQLGGQASKWAGSQTVAANIDQWETVMFTALRLAHRGSAMAEKQ